MMTLCRKLSEFNPTLSAHFGIKPRKKGTTPVRTIARIFDVVSESILIPCNFCLCNLCYSWYLEHALLNALLFKYVDIVFV